MKNQLSAHIFSGIWQALDWIFPPECAACGEPGYRLCLNCRNKINFITDWNEPHSAERGTIRPQIGIPQAFIPKPCSDSRHLAHYEGVIRECVHALKYEENRGLGELLSRWLTPLVREAGWPIDFVAPVPLSKQRQHARGYNQSALIARPLAARINAPYNIYGMQRVLDTPSQVGLSAEDRRKNVAGAFIAMPELVRLQNILLVDDVMTTGSTLSACAQALLTSGAKTVYAVTVARHIDKKQVFSMKCHQV